MTFDAWIAKILGSLADESGSLGARPKQRNRNPVEIRRMGPDELAQQAHKNDTAFAHRRA